MPTIQHSLKRQEVAYIVYVPNVFLLKHNPRKVEKKLKDLESSISGEMIAYSEPPGRLYDEGEALSEKDRQQRMINLQAIDECNFDLLILAGTGTTSYVREIIRRACQANMEIALYVDTEDCNLAGYLKLQQSHIPNM